MASRNERKRRAKARHVALVSAVAEALKKAEDKTVVVNPRHDVFDVPQALRGYRAPQERIGKIVKGKFVASPMKEPVKRTLTYDASQGRMIERRKRYI